MSTLKVNRNPYNILHVLFAFFTQLFYFWSDHIGNAAKWLYVIIMPRTGFRVHPHSIVCLNVKELLARSKRHIWRLSDSNGTRIHNHLIRKWTLKHLAKLAQIYEISGCVFESRCCHWNAATLLLCVSPIPHLILRILRFEYRIFI